MRRAINYVGPGLLWRIVLLCVGAVIIPKFLDHVYYEGLNSAHYDGRRFLNPD